MNTHSTKKPRYSLKQGIAKVGVNHVKNIVDLSNSIFHEIHQEDDIGIDAIIEIIESELPTGKNVAVQIKSGDSFHNSENQQCFIPVENHAEYWRKYPLPVFGIVYVPCNKSAYWTDIKVQLRQDWNASVIKFHCSRVNTFDTDNFYRLFAQAIIYGSPLQYTFTLKDFSLEEALELFHSVSQEESLIGMIALFQLYTDKVLVWDEFIRYFRQTSSERIHKAFAYYLSHIPWHMDIWGGRDRISDETKKYAKAVISEFEKTDVVKLLSLVDEEGISRGTIGQSVEAVIGIISRANEYLAEIASDETMSLPIRERAAIIYAYQNQRTVQGLEKSMALLSGISGKSEYARLILSDLKKFHGFELFW